MQPSILIVDDEPVFLASAARALRLEGLTEVVTIADSREVEALLGARRFEIAVLDVTMPHLDGLALLRLIKERSPATECIMLTARQDLDLVVRAFRLGAFDWQLKPLRPEILLCSIERALERGRLLGALLLRSDQAKAGVLSQPDAFAEFCTQDPGVLRLLREAELHAASRIPVLVTGETGVGKELIARGVHRASRRASGPFVAVNMLSLSPGLFEAEFFGHTRGAFTGAEAARPGYLGRAKGGTIFLDEIGDLSMEIQGKLLRILQEDEYVPVGSSEPRRADVRIVAAANLALGGVVEAALLRLPERGGGPAGALANPGGAPLPLAEVERRHILAAYQGCGCDKTHAARILGIGLQTLHRRLAAWQVG